MPPSQISKRGGIGLGSIRTTVEKPGMPALLVGWVLRRSLKSDSRYYSRTVP